MTPAELDELFTKNDRTLAAIGAAVGRLEERKRTREDGLLREIAERIESDGRFRYAVAMLAVDLS